MPANEFVGMIRPYVCVVRPACYGRRGTRATGASGVLRAQRHSGYGYVRRATGAEAIGRIPSDLQLHTSFFIWYVMIYTMI